MNNGSGSFFFSLKRAVACIVAIAFLIGVQGPAVSRAFAQSLQSASVVSPVQTVFPAAVVGGRPGLSGIAEDRLLGKPAELLLLPAPFQADENGAGVVGAAAPVAHAQDMPQASDVAVQPVIADAGVNQDVAAPTVQLKSGNLFSRIKSYFHRGKQEQTPAWDSKEVQRVRELVRASPTLHSLEAQKALSDALKDQAASVETSRHGFMRFWDHGAKADSSEAAPVPFAGSVERLENGERVFAPEPEGFELDKATLKDLQVFSQNGLFSQLDKTRTYFGSRRLAGLLKRPFLDAGEIQRRQEAVKAIASDEALRARLQEGFKRLDGKADKGLAEHFKTLEGLFGPVYLMGLFFGFWLPGAFIFYGWSPQVIQAVMTYFMIVGGLFSNIIAFREKLGQYKKAFQFAREMAGPLSKSSSPALRELGNIFSSVSDKKHPLGLRKVAGSFFHLLPRSLGVILDVFFLWGTKTLWRPIHLLRKVKARVAHLLGALGELDVYLTFAELLAAGGPWSMPVIEAGTQAKLRIEGGHHPTVLALRGKDSVANDADLQAGQGFDVVTGTNMGGKSTYLRMVALLTLLAQIGAPVPARAMISTPLELLTSVDVSDDLQSGKSLYDAETDRLLRIVQQAKSSTRLLAIMDEILQGTNPEERTAAERAVVRYLANTPNLFLVATHNLSIADIEKETPDLRNFHVAGEADKDVSRYSVLPGPAKDRNGILTLERKGFPESIVQDARERLSASEK